MPHYRTFLRSCWDSVLFIGALLYLSDPFLGALFHSFPVAHATKHAPKAAHNLPKKSSQKPLPLLVAYLGERADYPENTLLSIQKALDHKADMLWLTVQFSYDTIPMLYGAADLSVWTSSSGPLSGKTREELQKLNVGWNFKQDVHGTLTYPYREQPVMIPTLEEALARIPESIPIILEMNALPPEPHVKAVAQVINKAKAWKRVIFYSTEKMYQEALASYPEAQMFESREKTRESLLKGLLLSECMPPNRQESWVGFEYRRKLEIVEQFTLGEGRTPLTPIMWTKSNVACAKTSPKTHLLAFSIQTKEDYIAAACLGMDAVLVDSVQAMHALRQELKKHLTCPSETRSPPPPRK